MSDETEAMSDERGASSQRSMLNAQYSILNAQHSPPIVHRAVRNVQRSVLSAQRSPPTAHRPMLITHRRNRASPRPSSPSYAGHFLPVDSFQHLALPTINTLLIRHSPKSGSEDPSKAYRLPCNLRLMHCSR